MPPKTRTVQQLVHVMRISELHDKLKKCLSDGLIDIRVDRNVVDAYTWDVDYIKKILLETKGNSNRTIMPIEMETCNEIVIRLNSIYKKP